MADGGEGTLEVLETNLDLDKVGVIVSDPIFRPITAHYLKNEDTAFIEMAEASGLQRLKQEEYNPFKTSTFGTGELIKHAVDSGVKRINLFLGGSATNDAGIGMASALGSRFYSKGGNVLKPTGESLSKIHHFDITTMERQTSGVEFKVLTDVKNVLFGVEGASYVYAGQKGGDVSQIAVLDRGLKHLSKLLNNGNENLIGAGAAGGLGYGAMSFLNAKVHSGISFMLDLSQFDQKVKTVDLVITGEGRIDNQSLNGKVISGVMQIAKRYNKPVNLICGYSDIGFKNIPLFQIIDIAKDFVDAKTNSATYLQELGERIARDLQQPHTN